MPIQWKKIDIKNNFMIIIIDIFDNELKLIEIESKDKDIIHNFQPLDWFGEEVTNNIEYTNNYISYNNYLNH